MSENVKKSNFQITLLITNPFRDGIDLIPKIWSWQEQRAITKEQWGQYGFTAHWLIFSVLVKLYSIGPK